MTDYGSGDPPSKRPEPDGSDAATIDSEGPSLSAIAGKSPLVPTRDARFYISTIVFQVRSLRFKKAIIRIVFMESTGWEYHFSCPKKRFRGSRDRI
jgi:hypothetical protein